MQKVYPHRACRVAMDTVDTVGVGAKRSTHTVDSANMGRGDRYL